MTKKWLLILKKLLTYSLALLLLLGQAACSNKLSQAEKDLQKSQNAPAFVKISRKDLNIAIQTAPRHWRPDLPQTLAEKALIDQVYEGLVTLHNNRVRLQQAEKITPNQAATIWQIKLRDDLKWSDGSKLTAEDYRRSWLEHLNLAKQKPENARSVNGQTENLQSEAYRGFIIENAEAYSVGKAAASEVGIKVQGDSLIVKLTRPLANFPAWLSQSFFYPTKSTSDGKALYNGAYVLAEQSDKAIKLQGNSTYWDAINVWLKDINIAIIADEIQAYEAYHAGNLDFIGEPFYSIAKDRREAALRSAEKLIFPMARLGYIKLQNQAHKLFSVPEKRQALYALLDAPFQANAILQDNSEVWPERKTPTQVEREKAAQVLDKGLTETDLTELKEVETVGVAGPTILENRLLVASSKDWLNALKIRFRLQRQAKANSVPDFKYCTDIAPDGEMNSLLRLWDLKKTIKLDKAEAAIIWTDGDAKYDQAESINALWQNLASTNSILPLTSRNALLMVRPGLIGVSVDKTGKMLLSDLQWH